MTSLGSAHSWVVAGIALVVVALQWVAFFTTLRLTRRLKVLFAVGDLEIVAAGEGDLVTPADQRLTATAALRAGLTIRFRIIPGARRGTPAHQLIARTNDVVCLPDDIDGHLRSCANVATACSDLYANRATVLASVPIYLGLAGTFGGVIAGLSQLSAINEEAIPPFLQGVLVAMVCSLMGVSLMVVMNALVLPRVRIHRDRAMAEYLATVRKKLIAVVTAAIDRISHAGKPPLVAALDDVSYAMLSFKESLGPQKELIETLKALNLQQVITVNAEVNAALLKSTGTLMERFEKFGTDVGTMADALNKSTALISGLNALMDRVSEFEKNLNALGSKLAVDGTLTSRSIQWIEAEMKKIQQASKVVEQFAVDQDFKLREVMNRYNESFERVTQQASQTLVDVGERLAKGVEQSVDPERVATLFDHVGKLPAILDQLAAAAERDGAGREREQVFRQELKATIQQVAGATTDMAAASTRLAAAAVEMREARWLPAVLRRFGWIDHNAAKDVPTARLTPRTNRRTRDAEVGPPSQLPD